jgi:hypothetical protein
VSRNSQQLAGVSIEAKHTCTFSVEAVSENVANGQQLCAAAASGPKLLINFGQVKERWTLIRVTLLRSIEHGLHAGNGYSWAERSSEIVIGTTFKGTNDSFVLLTVRQQNDAQPWIVSPNLGEQLIALRVGQRIIEQQYIAMLSRKRSQGGFTSAAR